MILSTHARWFRHLWIGFFCLIVTSSGLHASHPALVTTRGLTVSVASFKAGPFSFSGGNLTVVANGTWFVGVDLYRNTLIALPRLGHRGWVPVARVVVGEASITELEQIPPVLPPSRIPRTLEKLRAGQTVNVVVMGSSLAEGGGPTTWSGMLFNASANPSAYRVPGVGTFRNIGLGGSPNQYMLAQLGYAVGSGRSPLFDGVDLVVLTCLANGGAYRLDIIEPLVRQLKARGVEIILLTDNPQNPTDDYASMQSSLLYRDGPEPIRVAERYGIELADTAAYVFEQRLRHGSGIYSDKIHMRAGDPVGPDADRPSGGHEIYARAVRSVLPIKSRFVGTPIKHSTFDDSLQGSTAYATASVASVDGRLKISKTTGNPGQWGGWIDIPPVKNGGTLRVQGTWSFENGYAGNPIQVGMQGGGSGWGSTTRAPAPGTFDLTVTATRDIPSGGKLLFFGNNTNAPLDAAFSIDDLIITLNPTVAAIDMIPGREVQVLPLAPARVVADSRTPADAIVILPKIERYHATNHAARGALGAHPAGANSFARRFLPTTGAAEDLLTLASGQKAVISGSSAVGFSLIRHASSTEAPVTLEVRRNDVLIKTLNLGTGYNREEYNPILTPAECAKLPPFEHDGIELTVTAGILKICALVALIPTADYR